MLNKLSTKSIIKVILEEYFNIRLPEKLDINTYSKTMTLRTELNNAIINLKLTIQNAS